MFKKHLPIIAVIVVSIAVHFLFFGHPKQTVFDEVHFGKFISGYFTHEYFFDIHPPLGKLIMSAAGSITGFQPGFSFGQIGEAFPDKTYLALRLLPTLAGTLLPVIFYLLLIELGFSKAAAGAGALAVALDNALLVQSRFMLLDAFLLLFGVLSWFFYARFRKREAIGYLLLAAIFAGAAASVKWTGITFLGIIGLAELGAIILKDRSPRPIGNLLVLVAVPFAVYYSIFAIHFSLLTKTGPGDAFMNERFRKTLVGSADSQRPDLEPYSTFEKFIDLNRQMYLANARLTTGHPYSSKWYTWPFMTRPIYYWNDATNSESKIYLVGNPLVWWSSTFAIVYVAFSGIVALIIPSFRRTLQADSNKYLIKFPWLIVLLVIAYIANMLPFVGIARAMFLYHYFPGLLVAIMALALTIDQLKNRRRVAVGFAVACVVVFFFFAPLSYGTPISREWFNYHKWMKSWE